MPNPKIKTSGIHYDGIQYFKDHAVEIELEENDNPNKPLGLGRPITVPAYQKMVCDWIDVNKQNNDQTASVVFGKEIILQILAQAGCEAIRFCFCINQDKAISLVAHGIDSSGKPLKSADIGRDCSKNSYAVKSSDPLLAEVGGGTNLKDTKIQYLQEATSFEIFKKII